MSVCIGCRSDEKASEYLIGRHDFTSFNATSLTEKPDQIRTVKDISFSMTYIGCDTPDECNEKALEVLKEDHFGIVLCYNANFDSTMHRYGPEAEVSLAQIDHNAKAFQTLVEAAKKTWKGKNAVFAFLPDHGCHEIDGNLGSHGLDMEEDMNIIHFYGFEKG